MPFKFGIFIVFFLIPLVGKSQTERTIEVFVSDTLHLPGQLFVFQISLEGNNPYGPEGDTITVEELQILASKFDQESEPINLQPLDLSAKVYEAYWRQRFQFSEASQLIDFVDSLRRYVNVSGQLEKIESIDEAPYVDRLNKQLLQQARQKASALAATIDATVGEVLEIVEVEPKLAGSGWTAYPPLSILPNFVPQNSPQTVVLERALRVVFSMK